jgi:hypothetical protein
MTRKLFICICTGLLLTGTIFNIPGVTADHGGRPSSGVIEGKFEDVTKSVGIQYRNYPPVFDKKIEHVNALWANFLSAAAVGDFNDDGFDDIFMVSSRLGHDNALYKNKGGKSFENVTARSGVANLNDEKNISSGALWFDYDNDGRVDLFIMRLGYNRLFKNKGDGTFVDVTAKAGIGKKHHNTITTISFDYNNDGYLDLLCGGFFADDVDLFNLKTTRFLPRDGKKGDNGGTKILYKNNGDGTFTDVTEKAGISNTGFTAALGHADYDNDGWQDFYIANDFGPDKLYHNNGNGSFTDVTEKTIGVDGKKGMNVDFGDFNNDGHLDIYVTNITEPWFRECNMFWINMGNGTFANVAADNGTCDSGWGWAGKFFDFDNDGLLDLYVADGFISGSKEDYVQDVGRWQSKLANQPGGEIIDASGWPGVNGKTFCGYERNRLFQNLGNETFKDVAKEMGVDLIYDSRGVALIDFDNDGAMDMLVTNSDQEPVLYHNRLAKKNNWLEIKLKGVKSNRNAIGARITISTGNVNQLREVNCGNGYASESTFRLHFGLGENARADVIQVKWPGGLTQTLKNVPANQILTLTEPAQTEAANKKPELVPGKGRL